MMAFLLDRSSLVPLTAANSAGAFTEFRNHLNGLFHRTITERPLVLVITKRDESEAFISFREDGNLVNAPLGRGWYLEFSQTLKAVPQTKGFDLETIKYRYAIYRDDTLQSDQSFVSNTNRKRVNLNFRTPRHHLHLHSDFDDRIDGIAPSRLHIPTGWVTIENIIRFFRSKSSASRRSISIRRTF